MADPVVWAPMLDWPAAFVPKVFEGMREWNADGPVPPPGSGFGELLQNWRVYEWRGPRLVCVNCPDAER
jgi:hypothetical protein